MMIQRKSIAFAFLAIIVIEFIVLLVVYFIFRNVLVVFCQLSEHGILKQVFWHLRVFIFLLLR